MATAFGDSMNLLRNDTVEEGTTDGILTAKVTAMVVLSLATFFLGFVPILLARLFKWNQASDVHVERTQNSRLFLSLLLAFGGGALLCTTFMHLLPEITETVADLQADGLIGTTDFSLAHMIMCAGFFMMYFIEELVHLYLHSREHREKKAVEIDQVLHRSFSMRKCSTVSSENKSAASETTLDCEAPSHDHDHNHDHDHGDHSHQDESRRSHGHKGGSHEGHSHMVLPDAAGGNEVVSSLRGLLIVVALSVHELFEGLAVGLESTTGGVYYMFGAVASHKLVLAFCVGLELVSARTGPLLNVVYLATFALVSPAGIGIGIALSEADSSGNGVVNVVLQGLACGTLLYVVFFEVLTREKMHSQSSGLLQLLGILVGFGTMFGLLMAAGHEHSHDAEHDAHVYTILDTMAP